MLDVILRLHRLKSALLVGSAGTDHTSKALNARGCPGSLVPARPLNSCTIQPKRTSKDGFASPALPRSGMTFKRMICSSKWTISLPDQSYSQECQSHREARLNDGLPGKGAPPNHPAFTGLSLFSLAYLPLLLFCPADGFYPA